LSRVLLVNLPHSERVQRRWVASYYAPNFLIPPVELMGLVSLLRERGDEAALVDAIAEELDSAAVAARFRRWEPDLVVGLSGFRILAEDLDALGAVRDGLPGCRSAIFGYLPTRAPDVVAAHRGVDYVLRGEPEETLCELVDAVATGGDLATIRGLAWKDDGGAVHVNDERPRVADLDALPFPDHGAVDLSHYNESFVPRPIGVVTSARGCPYDCSFCVRAYGRQIVYRSVDSLMDELSELRARGIRNVRFLDDTFTVDRKRTEQLCERMTAELPDLRWTCLTRLDRLDAPLARKMAAAGCRRVYVGIESGNAERLEAWGKGLNREQIRAGVRGARRAGIEVSGFFIVGAPGETPEETRASADFAASMGLDWVIATRLQYWPGTRLTRDGHGGVLMDLGEVEPGAGPEHDEALYDLERLFYRRFYLRPRWLAGRVRHALRSPRDSAMGAVSLGRWLAHRTPSRDFI